VYHPSGVGVCDGISDVRLVIQYIVLREGACYSSIVVLVCEARCSSPSCLLDSSIRREVCLHRRVARRIDVPHLQVACIAHAIRRLSDPLDQEVHHERSGRTVFIN
jgi:hypothetical protein